MRSFHVLISNNLKKRNDINLIAGFVTLSESELCCWISSDTSSFRGIHNLNGVPYKVPSNETTAVILQVVSVIYG
jgi:hypothetical protein